MFFAEKNGEQIYIRCIFSFFFFFFASGHFEWRDQTTGFAAFYYR